MNGYIVSVLMGLAVGVAYGHVQVRSSRWSAYWTVDVARHHFVRPTQISTRHLPDDARELG